MYKKIGIHSAGIVGDNDIGESNSAQVTIRIKHTIELAKEWESNSPTNPCEENEIIKRLQDLKIAKLHLTFEGYPSNIRCQDRMLEIL